MLDEFVCLQVQFYIDGYPKESTSNLKLTPLLDIDSTFSLSGYPLSINVIEIPSAQFQILSSNMPGTLGTNITIGEMFVLKVVLDLPAGPTIGLNAVIDLPLSDHGTRQIDIFDIQIILSNETRLSNYSTNWQTTANR